MWNCISNNEFPLNNITNELESLMTVPTHSQVLHYFNGECLPMQNPMPISHCADLQFPPWLINCN
ncbi:hypothetical protein ACE6H2_015656 [Prunus campanulata]